MKPLLASTLLILNFSFAFAQNQHAGTTGGKLLYHDISREEAGIQSYATIVGNDTLPIVYLKAAFVVDNRKFKNPIAEWKHQRLVRNVKKAYPYAKIAGKKIKEYNKLIVSTKSEYEKNRLLKECERKLIAEFESDIKNLTYSQGQILLKLIDRESGKTSYEILKQFRGSTTAFMWQSVARLFGNNLKSEYDPEKDDKQIESIVCLLENGLL